jgi:putative glutamine amidotransferase
MTETTEKSDAEFAEPLPKPGRWKRGLAIAIIAAAFLYLGYRIGFPIWMESRLPQDAPRIAFSPNDTWLKELGINKTYKLSFTLARGRLVEIQPSDTGSNPQHIAVWLKKNRIDGVLLAGGGDVDPRLYGGDSTKATEVNRARDDFEIALIKVAMEENLPILGICRGCQILNVARGGTLRNLRDDEELAESHFSIKGHAVDLTDGSQLTSILGTSHLSQVSSYHHQAVHQIGRNLRVSATGPGGVVEAIEGNGPGDPWIVAVQWHPEMDLGDPHQEALLRAFVMEAKKK